MSGNNPLPKTNTEREPDNIFITNHGGTTYTIREFMGGKEPLIDIITRHVMRDLEPDIPTV